MSATSIVPVQSRAEKKLFFNLPWRLYRGSPYWTPPLQTNQKELLNFKPHPFYERNRIQNFLAVREGEAVGRVSAILNQGHLDQYDDNRGFFGFYECEDRQETAAALLDAAHQWLREQGVEHMRGPTNPSLNYECGMLVEGFDASPTFMMTYNHDYYPKQMDAYGLHKTQDLYAFYARIDMLGGMDEKLRYMYFQIHDRFDVHLRPIDTKNFAAEVRMFMDIYNKSLPGTWGFVPMTDAEMDHASKGLKQLIVPQLTQVAEVDGRPVGAVFALPDYNPRIRKINGRLFPFGFIRLLYNRLSIPRIRLLSTNVLPEYQLLGLGLVLTGRLLPIALDQGVTEGEFSWVLESNYRSRKSLERGGALREKTYRIYDTQEPPEDPEAKRIEERDRKRDERRRRKREQAQRSGSQAADVGANDS